MHTRTATQSTAAALVAAALAGCASTAATGTQDVMRYTGVPDTAYAVVAEIRARPGKEAELREITLPLVEQVRAEPNNLLYFLQEDREAPGHFVFYEIFVSQADFEAHNATPHVQAWFARLPELAEGDVKVTRMHVLNNAGAPR